MTNVYVFFFYKTFKPQNKKDGGSLNCKYAIAKITSNKINNVRQVDKIKKGTNL